MSEISDKFYRYEAIEYAYVGIDGEYTSSSFPNPKIELITLNLWRETPKGYWIGHGYPHELNDGGRWVSKTAKKRYAYPTKKEALNNFIKRNERRIKILSRQLSYCEISVDIAKNMTV